MKGVVIVGGQGTRMQPFTRGINKHLLPIGPWPMFFWPLRTLAQAGVRETIIVCGGKTPGAFMEIAGQVQFGMRLSYTYQQEPLGICDALKCAKQFAEDAPEVMLLLGDTLLDAPLPFEYGVGGAAIIAQEVPDPQRCAVLEFGFRNDLQGIIEKPPVPPSQWGVLGAYLFDWQVWDWLEELQPSARGQYEVTDLHRLYLQRKQLRWHEYTGQYADAGTMDGYRRANQIAWEITDQCQRESS